MAAMKPIDLFNLLTPEEQQQAVAAIRQQQTPCQRNGHDYRVVGRIERWFAADQLRMLCKKCGRVRIV